MKAKDFPTSLLSCTLRTDSEADEGIVERAAPPAESPELQAK